MADELLVATGPHGPESHRTLAGRLGGKVVAHIPQLEVSLVRLPHGKSDLARRVLESDPAVLYVEPNGIAYADADPNGPYDNTTCYQSLLRLRGPVGVEEAPGIPGLGRHHGERRRGGGRRGQRG